MESVTIKLGVRMHGGLKNSFSDDFLGSSVDGFKPLDLWI